MCINKTLTYINVLLTLNGVYCIMLRSEQMTKQIEVLEKKLQSIPQKKLDGKFNPVYFALSNRIKRDKNNLQAQKNFEHLAK